MVRSDIENGCMNAGTLLLLFIYNKCVYLYVMLLCIYIWIFNFFCRARDAGAVNKQTSQHLYILVAHLSC